MTKNERVGLVLAGGVALWFVFRSKDAQAAELDEDMQDITVAPDEQGPAVVPGSIFQQPGAVTSPGLPDLPTTQPPSEQTDDQEAPPPPVPKATATPLKIPATVEEAVAQAQEGLQKVLGGASVQDQTDVQESQSPTVIPEDTLAILSIMLAAEATPDWKVKLEELKPWQKSRGLKPDGLYGVKSATKMAEETGLLPIIRFWPSGTTRTSGVIEDYKAALLDEASSAEQPRKSQLKAAVDREQGQGFDRVKKPISPTIALS